MTTYTLRSANAAKTRCDAVAIGLFADGSSPQVALGGEEVAAAYGRKFRPLLASLGLTGKAGECLVLPTNGVITAPLLVVVGLGGAPRQGEAAAAATLRAGAGTVARALTNAATVAVALPADTPGQIESVLSGLILGGYTFTEYKSTAKKSQAPGQVSVLSPIARQKEAIARFERAEVVSHAVAKARDWVNEPPVHLRPPAFAAAVEQAAKKLGGRKKSPVQVTVWDEGQLADERCGGILGVGGGSDAPPRLVRMEYSPKTARAHLALVGKGITFDSGGYTIKPGNSMNDMKSDMGGAAAVVQATLAIAELGLPIRVTTVVPMAENMVSGSAMRPSDVLTMRNGTTVEVLNTDAEGRLILADALVLAAEAEPDLIVDVATLTGHMVLALGDRIAALFDNSDEARERILDAGERVGERYWPMPITEEVETRLASSRVADLAQHDWVRWGGGLLAAGFLREFVDGRAWAHLDIAGPAFISGTSGHLTAGGTGFAVATLVELADSLSAQDATDQPEPIKT